ncbi:MAG: hypothetical protein AAFZ52_07550, partial [Bacteroidota bacterium]
MRKLLFSMLVLFLSASALMAQQGEDALKAAKKAFDKFSLNQDAAALTEASDMLMAAMKDPGVAADPSALVEACDIYSAMINQYVVTRSTGVGETSDAYKLAAVAGAKAY